MQDDEFHHGRLVRKCQVETCPQPARPDVRSFKLNHNLFVALRLCHYHANWLQITGFDRYESTSTL